MILTNKKVLLIAPKFFNYEIEIKHSLQRLGAEVDYFDERPKDFFTKALIRLNMRLLIRYQINQHLNKIKDKIKDKKYDFILFISPETSTEYFIAEVRKIQKNARMILYMYDSVHNKSGTIKTIGIHKIVKYFDKMFTFDKDDSQMFNFQFLPLFYIPIYEVIKNKKEEVNTKYSLCFIGTAHGDRYEMLKKIKEQADDLGIEVYFFMYLSNKALFYMRKYITKELKGANKNEFSFEPLSSDKIIEIVSQSKVIIDIESQNQGGLTMRIIEMIGAEKKIISTNASIVEYDFYNPNNFLIIDRKNPKICSDFIHSKYIKIDKPIYSKYKIDNWVKSLLL